MQAKSAMFKNAYVFVDGENLRGVIGNLFAAGGGPFNPYDYLPKRANWGGFFQHAVSMAGARAGIHARWARTYWYVIEDIDTVWLPKRDNHDDVARLLDERAGAVLKFIQWRREKTASGAARISPGELADAVKWINARARAGKNRADSARAAGGVPESVLKVVDEMWRRKRQKEREFRWKRERESAIESGAPIRFRRSGHIRFDPLVAASGLGREKTTDVNLALDMLLLKDNYDIAVIVSGDQDFVPAVRAAQDAGKTVVNVVFLTRDGKFLPGGARRLSAAADWSVEIDREGFLEFLNLPVKAPSSASIL